MTSWKDGPNTSKNYFETTEEVNRKYERTLTAQRSCNQKKRAAVSRMKGNKARGPDGIVIEIIKALDDFGIEKLTIMANEI